MRIIQTPGELSNGKRKVCAAIGFFDGVHLGHAQVIRQTLADARQHEAVAVAVTFDRHPNTVVAPAKVPPLIYSLPQKLRAIESLGVDATLLLKFDQEFSRQSGEQFIRGLAREFGQLHSLCVGGNFVFGHKRSGNVALLKTLGQELRFIVHGMAALSLDGKVVSSTRIRETIKAGQLDAASQMLGRAYSLAGIVARGDQLGRKLGFPTANIDTNGLVVPPNGVYAVLARIDGEEQRAVANIGVRPTLSRPEPRLQVEVHVLDFNGDLYGKELEVTFVDRIREERKFASVDELKAQIQRDIDTACERF